MSSDKISYWLREDRTVVRQTDSSIFNYSGPLVETVAYGITMEARNAAFRLLASPEDVERNLSLGRKL